MVRQALALLLLVPLSLPAQESPRDIVTRAIAAHGGMARLSQVRADRVVLRGDLFVGSVAVPFTNVLALQLPGQFKSVVQMQAGRTTRTIVHILDGEHASVSIDGKPQKVGAAQLARLRRTLQLEQALRLVPLLDERSFTLRPIGAFTVNGRVVQGVAVEGKGQHGLKLFFDKESARLAATEHVLDGVVQQARYDKYRDVGGCLRPGKMIVYRGGKKVMEAELAEARRVDRIPAEEFQTR